jgi:hypothetical protein
MRTGAGISDRQGEHVNRSGRRVSDRVARRRAGGWALALAAVAAALVAGPAGAAPSAFRGDQAVPPPGMPSPGPDPGRPTPHPDRPTATVPAAGAPAPAAPKPAAAPRPVTPRPTAGGTGAANDTSLAVRRLTVRARVGLSAARPAQLTVSFVPRPGSLVAQVRLFARDASGGRRLMLSRMVAVRSGRRATVRLRVAGMRPGAYDVAVRAGAGRATLGPAIVARLQI